LAHTRRVHPAKARNKEIFRVGWMPDKSTESNMPLLRTDR
jgi:hypothetical protein